DVLRMLLAESDGRDIVYGDLMVKDPGVKWKKAYPDVLTFGYFRYESLPHPCTLIKRSLFDTVHRYHEDLRIVSDWAFFTNAICLHGATYKHVSHPIAVFSRDGVSSLPQNVAKMNAEKDRIFKQYYPAFWPDYQESETFERWAKNSWRFVPGRRLKRAFWDLVARASGKSDSARAGIR